MVKSGRSIKIRVTIYRSIEYFEYYFLREKNEEYGGKKGKLEREEGRKEHGEGGGGEKRGSIR